MTREEKEQTGKYVLQMARLLEDGCYQQEMLLKAVYIIDEALEQEPTKKETITYLDGFADGLNMANNSTNKMLDKIRAEIEKAIWEDVIVSLDGTDEITIPRLEPDDVFEILDKYKRENENKE